MILSDKLRNSFEPDLIREIQEKGKPMIAKEGTIILDIGQTVRIIPLVLKGTLKISRVDETGKEIFLYYVLSDESCAMTFTCCMQQFPSEVRATAETELELISIPMENMDQWLIKYPTWKSFVMRTIRNRFNELLHSIDQLAFQKLDERLVHYLKEKSRVTGSNLIHLSHEQIATDMASSREVISRLLKKLENDGKVLLYRNELKLLREL